MNIDSCITSDKLFDKLWSKIPKSTKFTFAATFIIGLITHIFAFTNKFLNHDDVGHLFEASYGTPSGRWFLPFVLSLDGDFSMPWLIGVLSILCISITACLVCSILRVKKPINCILIGGILATFPTVAATFSYMFTSDAYFFGCLLAVLGAYVSIKFKWIGIPLGAIFLTLSMGIYQSYFPIAVALMIAYMLFETLDGKQTLKALIIRGFLLIATLFISMVAYFITVRITTANVGLVDYMGISSMGKLSISDLPSLIKLSYVTLIDLFLRNSTGYHNLLVRFIIIAIGICGAILFIALCLKNKKNIKHIVLAVILMIIYPLACNLIYIMVNGDATHDLMLYGSAFLPIAAIALIEYANENLQPISNIGKLVKIATSLIITLSMISVVYNYMIVDNKIYFKMQISAEQCKSYSTRLVSAIQNCDGYSPDLPIVFIGNKEISEDLYPTPVLDQINTVGVQGFAALRTSYTYTHFLKYYLAYTDEIYEQDTDVSKEMAENPEVSSMPNYPEDGSIKIIDDMVVVKFN